MNIKTKSSVKTVKAKKTSAVRKCAAKKPAAKSSTEKSVLFTVRAEPGKQVFLAGCFNKWSMTDKPMLDKKNEGVYSCSVKLAPGTYQYKFVIDGTWCADPENADFVQNEHGTFNSVIVVK